MSGDDPKQAIARAIADAEPLLDDDAAEAEAGDGADPGPDYPPDSEDVNWPLLRLCAAEPTNDLGNSRRLRHRFGGDIAHVQNVGFHAWDGTRWAEDVDFRVTRPLCHQTVELIGLEPLVMGPAPEEQAAIEADDGARERVAGAEAASAAAETDEARAAARHDLRKAAALIDDAQRARKAVASRRARRRTFAVASGNTGKLNGMLNELIAYCSRAVSEMDADPMAINLTNGTLRPVVTEVEDPDCPDPEVTRMMRQVTFRLDPHARADLITKRAGTGHDPEARCPAFEAFIARILPDPAVRGFVQRYLGYAMTGDTREQCFCIWHGEGRNGKSTLIDVVARVLGDYATSLPIQTLVTDGRQGKGSEATPDLARLPGARLVRTAEPKEGVGFDEGLIKSLTSGEPIAIRRLHQEFIDVYPTFKMVVSANRKPTIRGNDDGIWRRVRLVPFTVQIPVDETDATLPEKLWAEREGILNWLLDGLAQWLVRGLDAPQAVIEATGEYREEMDLIGEFADRALIVTGHDSDRVGAGALYEAFAKFCRIEGSPVWGAAVFRRRMPAVAARRGIVKVKASSSYYANVVVRHEFQPSEADRKRDGMLP